MAQDFLYSTLPACELTDERVKRLIELCDEQSIVAPPDSELNSEEVEICRGEVRQAVEELSECVGPKGKETADFYSEGMTHRLWMAGCMSWGETTEAMDIFEEVNRFPVVYFQLLDWAKEDFAKNPEPEANRSNFVQFCLG